MSDVELVNINFSLSPSLIAKKVDAVIGAFRNFELNQMDIVNHPGRAFYPEEHGVPTYEELIYIANQKNNVDKMDIRGVKIQVLQDISKRLNEFNNAERVFYKGKIMIV